KEYIQIESLKSSTQPPIVNEFFVINIPEEDVEPQPNLQLQEIIILDPDDQPMWKSAKTVAPTPNSAIVRPDGGSAESSYERPTVEVIGNKAHGPVPEPGCVVIARVTKVMARMASADVMCVGSKSVQEKFSGIIRQQDVRATEIDKVDMHTSFRPGDIVKASGISLGDARAYYLSTAQNELGVVSAESMAGNSSCSI
nr:exosome complex component CSL4 [Tanacetum cinerariifolium]